MDNTGKILILGIGNDILSDDAIGVRLVRDLEQIMSYEGIDFKHINVGGLELLEELNGYQKAIIIDGIITGKHAPATVYHFRPHNFKETLHLSNFHNVTFKTTSKLSARLGIQMPEQIHILAVEIVENEKFSSTFSKSLQPFYSKIKMEITKIIEKIIEKKVLQKTHSSHGNWL